MEIKSDTLDDSHDQHRHPDLRPQTQRCADFWSAAGRSWWI